MFFRMVMACVVSQVLFIGPVAHAQNETSQIINEGVERIEENRDAQKIIDKAHNKRLDLIEDYEDTLKVVEGLHAYNDMMKRQVARQQDEMEQLRTSITDVSIIERQILPLLSRMLDGLEEFVKLDVPFLQDERNARIARLREILERVDVTAAEKTRRVFEAYQIETEYGRTIEAYRSKLRLDNGVLDVDYLRIGRTALLYRTVGTEELGQWNKKTQAWESVSASQYRRFFNEALKVARQEKAPDLITVPVLFDGGV